VNSWYYQNSALVKIQKIRLCKQSKESGRNIWIRVRGMNGGAKHAKVMTRWSVFEYFSCYTPLCLPFLLLKFGLVVFLCMTCLSFFSLLLCTSFFLEGERRSTCVIYPAINFIVNRYFSVACFFCFNQVLCDFICPRSL